MTRPKKFTKKCKTKTIALNIETFDFELVKRF